MIVAAAGTAFLLAGTASAAVPLGVTNTTAWQATDIATTAITLEVTPTGPVDGNTVETLTATVDPSTAAGTVQFNDGSTSLSDPVAVTDGTASTTATLPAGDHSLTADFTPEDPTAFSGSISNTVTIAVNGAPATTSSITTLEVTPASPVDGNTLETLTAMVDPSTAAGTVQFNDGGTPLGELVAVTDGTASTTATLPAGDHSLTADFTPDDATAFSGSTSNTVTYSVNSTPTPAAMTTMTLEVTPASPAEANTTETLTATVDPSGAVGTVQFNDGSTPLGDPVTVVDGTASTSTILPAGDHSLTADFTPDDATAFSGSTSNTVTYPVNTTPAPAVTTTTLTVVPSWVFWGHLPVFLIARVTPTNAVGTVQFMDGTTALGAPRPVRGGFAVDVTGVPTNSTNSLTAVFTPGDPVTFDPSTSAPVSLAERSLSRPGPHR